MNTLENAIASVDWIVRKLSRNRERQKTLRLEAKNLVAELKSEKMSETLATEEKWKKTLIGAARRIADSGMTRRETEAIEMHTLGTSRIIDLARIWGVSASRASQIIAKARRKMRHPSRIAMAEELGIE